jgi:hypothetical protein
MEQEVHCVEVRQFKAFDLPQTSYQEMFFDPFCGHLANQQRVVLGTLRDEPNVHPITLVAGPGMRQLD